MLCSHCIRTYSQTQDTRALSSGESEFYGIVKAAAMGIGIKSLMEDLGLHVGSSEYGFKCWAEHLNKKRCWASSTRGGA